MSGHSDALRSLLAARANEPKRVEFQAYFDAALDTLRKGAPGLAEPSRVVLARSIAMKCQAVPEAISPSYTHLQSRLAEAEKALREIRQDVENWFTPWGAWKTAWWEDFASDDHEYTSENFIKTIGRRAQAYFKRSAEPGEKR